MLINEQNSDIFSIAGIRIKGLLNDRCFGFGINDQKVLLGVGRGSDMLMGASNQYRSFEYERIVAIVRLYQQARGPLQSPAESFSTTRE